jgi:hypothetical protein
MAARRSTPATGFPVPSDTAAAWLIASDRGQLADCRTDGDLQLKRLTHRFRRYRT